MHSIVDLDGTNVARLRAEDGEEPHLTLMSPAYPIGPNMYPAESFAIAGRLGLENLRNLINEYLDGED
jgi:acetoacetate decarboxylase